MTNQPNKRSELSDRLDKEKVIVNPLRFLKLTYLIFKESIFYPTKKSYINYQTLEVSREK